MARPAVVALNVILVVLVSVVADANLIARTCKRTTNPYCVKMLLADPWSAKATTVRELAGVALDIAAAAVRDGSATVHSKYLGHQGKPLEDTLLGCEWMYGHAVGEARAAADAFRSGEYRDAVRHQLAGHYAAILCEEMISHCASESPVADADRRTVQHCNLAVDLIELLH
ncbi:hypothetical protein E2562_037965 [Oryza meyeriana var. granulata]|uniref:Pectinesterase inhibitor domain-containing protein n=1 Tax=Oryza meyeriana var. granulata TaxID=110450 RepID=A0A6G1CKX5_9ORYZ|nr:hypothetical protein E2562_037965 [Oryza meyeriana var. granulata]